jgi:hypothetical protein
LYEYSICETEDRLKGKASQIPQVDVDYTEDEKTGNHGFSLAVGIANVVTSRK